MLLQTSFSAYCAFIIFIIYLLMYKLCIIVMFVDKLHYLISGLVIISLVIMLCDYYVSCSCLLIIIIFVY